MFCFVFKNHKVCFQDAPLVGHCCFKKLSKVNIQVHPLHPWDNSSGKFQRPKVFGDPFVPHCRKTVRRGGGVRKDGLTVVEPNSTRAPKKLTPTKTKVSNFLPPSSGGCFALQAVFAEAVSNLYQTAAAGNWSPGGSREARQLWLCCEANFRCFANKNICRLDSCFHHSFFPCTICSSH